MSTLSELIPSGGTQNNIEFVAQGTLANGQTVALRSDGKVEAVSGGLLGSPVTGAEAAVASLSIQQRPVIGYHLASKKVVVFWSGTSNYLYASVGTVSGTTLTYSTPQVITSSHRVPANVIYDPDQEVLIILARDNNTSGYFQAFSVSSDGTLTNGSEVYYTSYGMYIGGFSYDTAANKTVWVFGGSGSGADGYGFAVSMTCSGTTLTVNTSSTHTFASHNTGLSTVSYDPVADKHIIFYGDDSNGTYKTNALTVSGNGFTSGTAITTTGFKGESTSYAFTYDSVAKKHILFVYDGDSPKSSSAVAFNISGSTITYGSPLEYRTSDARYAVGVYDTGADRVIAVSVTSGGAAYWYILTVDNLTLTAATGGTIATSGVSISAGTEGLFLAYDSTTGTVITSYNGASNGPVSRVLKSFETNVASYIGITNAAISSGATGEVAVKGGLSTTASFPTTIALGAEASLYSGTNYDRRINYDPSNNKFLAVLRTGSGGAVQVGTLSGTTMAWGTAVTFSGLSNSESDQQVSYNSNTQSFLITFPDSDNSSYPTAMVAKISGTSVTLGTRAVISSTGTPKMYLTYDSTAQKNVIGFAKNGTNYNFGIVATIDGSNNTVSFGSEQVFDTSGQNYVTGVTYDPTSNKTLFTRINNVGGVGTVGTVSGTSISFGSDTAFGTSENPYRIETVYDASAQKLISTYVGDIGSQQVKSRVATISGTSVAFGTQVTFGDTGVGSTDFSATYAPSINAILYTTSSSSTYGQITVLTSDGTNVSVGSSTQYSGVDTDYLASAFDTANSKVVVLYDVKSSNAAKYIAGDVSSAGVIGSNYFVQDDGTLATTSSSNKAGKAISTTALNLVDPT